LSFYEDEYLTRIEFEKDSLERMREKKWSKKEIKKIKREWKEKKTNFKKN